MFTQLSWEYAVGKHYYVEVAGIFIITERIWLTVVVMFHTNDLAEGLLLKQSKQFASTSFHPKLLCSIHMFIDKKTCMI